MSDDYVFDHVGITTTDRAAARGLGRGQQVWVTNPRNHPEHIEFLRYREDTQVPAAVIDNPHVAYRVKDLKPHIEAEGVEILIPTFIVGDFVEVVFVRKYGTIFEYMRYLKAAGSGTERDRRSPMSAPAELARRIRTKELSPVEVMDATIARIEAAQPEPQRADLHRLRRRAGGGAEGRGRGDAGRRPAPLHGVPAAIKDLFDFKPGWPTTYGGVRALKDNIAQFHCLFAERIERGGAILVGKTNAPVMGLRGVTDNYLFGPTSNPFDVTRNPGGSSGGSAAAVADGLLPFAEGTDAGGSIRIPAAWCGVYRLQAVVRPRAGGDAAERLRRRPAVRLRGADHAHGRGRGAGDDGARRLRPARPAEPRRAGRLPRGAAARDTRACGSPTAPTSASIPSIRGWPRRCGARSSAFEEAGAIVEEVKVGIALSQRELSDLWYRLMMPLNLGTIEAHKAWGQDLLRDHRDDFPPEYLEWIERGLKMTAADQRRDQVLRTGVYDAVQSVFADHDLLVTPTLATLPSLNQPGGNTRGPEEVNGEAVDQVIGWCLTYPFNFTGHPAASIPAGLADGLPVGMQIVGRRLCRCRRVRRERGVRAAAAVG